MDATDSPTFPTQKSVEASPEPDLDLSEQDETDTEDEGESLGSDVGSESGLSDTEPKDQDSGDESDGAAPEQQGQEAAR